MASWASIVSGKTTQATATQATTTQATATQATARQVSIKPTTTFKKEESVALEQKKEHQI